MERKIGERFFDNGVLLEVVQGYGCNECGVKNCANNKGGNCFRICRADGKSVIFKQVEVKAMKKYTKQQFLKAAELGEVSMVDAEHIVSLLDDAEVFDCTRCVHSSSHPFDQYYCRIMKDNGEPFDLEKEDCNGKYFKGRKI